MLGALNQSMVDEGLDIGGSASKAGKILSGGLRAASQGTRAIRQSLPRGVDRDLFNKQKDPEQMFQL